MPDDELIGTADAAAILGVTLPTIKRLALRGDALQPAVKMRGKTGAYLFRRADVERLAAARAEAEKAKAS